MTRSPSVFMLLCLMCGLSIGPPAPARAGAAPGTQSLYDWAEVTAAGTAPTSRREHCAIYDPVLDHMIVYGGAITASVNERTTWQFEWLPVPKWTQIQTTQAPPAGRGMSAVYDPVRRRMIVFGGDLGASNVTNEVWTLALDSPTSWQRLTTQGTPPSARMFSVVNYDPAGDRLVVFSGLPETNDTWTLSLAEPPTWTQVTGIASSPPGARWGSSGVFDPVQNRLVVFSGYPQNVADTYTLNFSGTPTWVQHIILTGVPPARVAASAIYDPVDRRMVLYGGLAGSTNHADAWALTLDGALTWQQVPSATPKPPLRRFHTAVYRSQAKQMVVYGGFEDAGQVFRGDVWGLQLLASAGEPLITGFAPLGGEVGDAIAISGVHLSTAQSVEFNGVAATFSVASDVGVIATVPAGATTGPIRLVTLLGSDTTATDFVVGIDPQITSAQTESARVGESVLILGSHFTGATHVRFGASGAASFHIDSDTQITATLDALASDGPIHVTSVVGAGQSAFSFSVLLPNPRPKLQPVRDVPLDQGGSVVLRWGGSDFDRPQSHTVTQYRVWRRTPLFAVRSGSAERLSIPTGEQGGVLPQLNTDYWEPLVTLPAAMLPGYGYTAPTLNDSMAQGNPFTAFVIQALTSDVAVFYFSNIDSGYSVDNLAPSQPALLIGTPLASGVRLRWKANIEPDLSAYRVYRGDAPGFEPGPLNLLGTVSDTVFVDAGNPGGTYKVRAVDVHGNAGPHASVTVDRVTAALISSATAEYVDGRVLLAWQLPSLPLAEWALQRSASPGPWVNLHRVAADDAGSVSFEDATVQPGERYAYRIVGAAASQPFVSPELSVSIPAAELSLLAIGANPRRYGHLELEFTLPSAAPARIVLVDVSGRILESRDVGDYGAGRHHLRLSEARSLRPGMHFIRLTQGIQSITTRIAVVQ